MAQATRQNDRRFEVFRASGTNLATARFAHRGNEHIYVLRSEEADEDDDDADDDDEDDFEDLDDEDDFDEDDEDDDDDE